MSLPSSQSTNRFVSFETIQGSPSSRDAFLQRLEKETDLPAMGSAVARVVQLTSSDNQVVRDLTYLVLSDVALTQKILRLANAVQYRAVSSGQVTTVSRAIFLMGFETVRTTALTMLLVEGFSDRKHSHAVSVELKRAMCASAVGREMARVSRRVGAEEAAIAALFANVGQIMVAAYDYPHYEQVSEMVTSEKVSEEQGAIRVLGYGYASLSQSILRSWKIPESIIQAILLPPGGVLRSAKNPQEWMQQIVAFSVEASRYILSQVEEEFCDTEDRLIARFGKALDLDKNKLRRMRQSVQAELALLSKIMSPKGITQGKGDEDIPDNQATEISAHPESEDVPGQATSAILDHFLMKPEKENAGSHEVRRHPSGKPVDAKELLLEGLQRIMQISATGRATSNDIMLLALETLFNSMGFRFAAICVKDKNETGFHAEVALGEDRQRRKNGFVFEISHSKDLFNLSMENDMDLMIPDLGEARIQALLPAWHRKLFPDAKSLMVLPISVNQKQLGFFYGDRVLPAPEGVSADETALIRLMKTHIHNALIRPQV